MESPLLFDEGADAVPGFDESFGAEHAECLADGGQAHPKPFDQRGLGRESLSGGQVTISDLTSENVGDAVVLRCSGAWTVGHGAQLLALGGQLDPLEHWLAYRQRSAALYADIAEIDRGHHHEALYWAERERESANEIKAQISTQLQSGND